MRMDQTTIKIVFGVAVGLTVLAALFVWIIPALG